MAQRKNSRSQLDRLKEEITSLSNGKQAENLSRFFKTGKGDYGEGDEFIGLTMPQIRSCARQFRELSVSDLNALMRSPIHEERMIALIIITLRYPKDKDTFYILYIKNRKYINNWDLVDVTCPRIVGDYLQDKPRNILYTFARSKNLWERRISIISTAAFIQKNDFSDTLRIAEILLQDPHDLIHKAAGWMLREVGRRDKKVEVSFLNKHHRKMPRTMLRYAIEKFPESQRKRYLKMAGRERK